MVRLRVFIFTAKCPLYRPLSVYCIAGKLLREKTFANFKVLWLFAKVFSVRFGGVVSFGGTIGGASEQSAKILFSTNLRKFPAMQ